MDQVISDYLKSQGFLKFQKVQQTKIPRIIQDDGIYFFDQRGQGIQSST